MKKYRVYYRWPGDTHETYITVLAKDAAEADVIFRTVILTPDEAMQVIVTRVQVVPKEN